MGSCLIESRLVGRVIGPRGATIQQLQSEFNVHISISKEDDQNGNRTAEVRGSDEDVQNAIAAIQERFCSGGGGTGGGGYRSGGSGGYQGGSGGYRRSYNNQQGGYQQGGGGYQQGGGGGYQGGYQQGGGYRGGQQQQQSGYNNYSNYSRSQDNAGSGW